jgi:hypothetical protein
MVMTKRELHRNINKQVYELINNHPDCKFEIDSSEGYGLVYFRLLDLDGDYLQDGDIEYHQSRHDLCTVNWAPEGVRNLVDELQASINKIVAHCTEQYNVLNGLSDAK